MERISKYIIIGLLTLFSQFIFSQDCKKCDIDVLLEVSENIENLNLKLVKDFVCTFDTVCKYNIEFSEWSNELLFKVIENDINLLNKSLYDLGYNYVLLIANEIENPIIEVNFTKIYGIIKESQGPKDMIVAEKNAIIEAAEKEGINLK